MDNMLRKALWEFLRPLLQLVQNLLNPDIGEEWLVEFKKFLRKEKSWDSFDVNPEKLKLRFIGDDWIVIHKDSVDRSSQSIVVSPKNIRLVSKLEGKETWLGGKEYLTRLNASNFECLDAFALRFFWNNEHLIPEHWKKDSQGNARHLFFEGTQFLSPKGERRILTLVWDNDSELWLMKSVPIAWARYRSDYSVVMLK